MDVELEQSTLTEEQWKKLFDSSIKSLNFWHHFAIYSGEAKIKSSNITQVLNIYKTGDRSKSTQRRMESFELDTETRKEWEDYYG